MNLVIGSTGMVGSEVCRLLKSRNLPVRGNAKIIYRTYDMCRKGRFYRYGKSAE